MYVRRSSSISNTRPGLLKAPTDGDCLTEASRDEIEHVATVVFTDAEWPTDGRTWTADSPLNSTSASPAEKADARMSEDIKVEVLGVPDDDAMALQLTEIHCGDIWVRLPEVVAAAKTFCGSAALGLVFDGKETEVAFANSSSMLK